MRKLCSTYERSPEALAGVVTIGWTQKAVMMEAESNPQERAWYIRAVRRFGWSKLELQRETAANMHLEIALDAAYEVCYTEEKA